VSEDPKKETPKEEPAKPADDVASLKAELAKQTNMATKRKDKITDLETRLADMETKLNERSEKDRDALAKAGKVDELKQEYEAQINALQREIEAAKGTSTELETEVKTYRERDEKRLETLLEGREDKDQILEDLDGLPLAKKLTVAERLVGKEAETPPGYGGKPANRVASETPNLDQVKNDPDFQKFAKENNITDDKELDGLAQHYAANVAKRVAAETPAVVTQEGH